MLQVVSPFQQFFDTFGEPLDAGYIYIGESGQNPQTSPIAVYWDEAGTIPAAQPLRTTNGYLVRGGTPARIYVNDIDYSITVRTTNGLLVFTALAVSSVSYNDLAESSGSSLIGFIQSGSGAVARTVQSKSRDIVSVKDFGAVGNGIADDTAEIALTLAESTGAYFPDGTYLYTGDIDALFANPIWGPGLIEYDGFEYPAARENVINYLWPGELQCWPMGHALVVETTQRQQIPSGVTHARTGFASGTTIIHVEGGNSEDAMRIQRTSGTAGTSNHVVVMNLTREETKVLAGNSCVLQINGSKSSTYTGGDLTYRIQYSEEPEQPILNADGTYTSGNVNLDTGTITLGATARPESAPYFFGFDLPSTAIQVSVVISIPFVGTAGADDYVDIENCYIHVGPMFGTVFREPFANAMLKSGTRYQSSYPYGAPRGAASEQGAISAVAINTAAAWAFAIPVRFSPRMSMAPQFIFQSPTSGTESRILNKDSGANLNGLAHSLNDAGVVITNSAAATANNRYLCHWTAQLIF